LRQASHFHSDRDAPRGDRFREQTPCIDGPADSARIYLLQDGERQVVSNGPAIVGPDGVRQDVSPLVFKAVQHVVEAMRASMAVKVTPLRPELPIDEAADAIGMGRDDLRAHAAEGAIPFRSTEYVDWVRLDDVIAFDRRRREQRRAGVQQLLDEKSWDEPDADGTQQ
jgi:hypothetical protein